MTHEELAHDASPQIVIDRNKLRQNILDAIQDAVAPLEQEIQALKADKERLNWLLSQGLDFYERGSTRIFICHTREEIDAAMKEVPEKSAVRESMPDTKTPKNRDAIGRTTYACDHVVCKNCGHALSYHDAGIYCPSAMKDGEMTNE